MTRKVSITDGEFELFQKMLISEAGLRFYKDRTDSLCYVLDERIKKRGLASAREYYDFLKYNSDGSVELQTLLDLVTIGETYFFRNKPHFDALVNFILPEIIKKKENTPAKSIRIWSAGCSKGDEAYSIAISLRELLPSYKDWNISILATDLNRNVLRDAKNAVYRKKDIASFPEKYLTKYFSEEGNNYVLDESVKKMVNVKYHNLAKDPFALEEMKNLDIIFCRNVTIYFDLETTRTVINGFYDRLLKDGYLFIGHSETLWKITNRFETIEFPRTFIYKKTLHPVEEIEAKPFMGIPSIDLDEIIHEETLVTEEPKEKEVPAETVMSKNKGSILYVKAAKLFREKKYQEAFLAFDEVIKLDKNHIDSHFAKAVILANRSEYEDATKELKKIIKTDNLYLEAYYLLGVLAHKTGDLTEAENRFRKCVYIDPGMVLAYFNLGNIYLYEKRLAKATREFNNAIRLLEGKPKEEPIKFCEDFTADFLLRACRNNLLEIGAGNDR